MSDSLYRCRPLILSGVLGFWAICLIEAIPASSAVHKKLDETITPLLSRTSLWQNDWALFAPVIDHYNEKIEWVITWDDGTQSVWTHPDWTDISQWERIRRFRIMEYYDSVTAPSGQRAWAAFADVAVAEMTEESGKTPRLAEMMLYSDTIDPPQKMWRKAFSSPPFASPPQKAFTWYPNAISESEIQLYGN